MPATLPRRRPAAPPPARSPSGRGAPGLRGRLLWAVDRRWFCPPERRGMELTRALPPSSAPALHRRSTCADDRRPPEGGEPWALALVSKSKRWGGLPRSLECFEAESAPAVADGTGGCSCLCVTRQGQPSSAPDAACPHYVTPRPRSLSTWPDLLHFSKRDPLACTARAGQSCWVCSVDPAHGVPTLGAVGPRPSSLGPGERSTFPPLPCIDLELTAPPRSRRVWKAAGLGGVRTQHPGKESCI